MKKTTLIFLLISFLFSLQNLTAQNGVIKGQLLDNNKTPISYANITLMTSDTIFITGAISNEEGRFEFKDLTLQPTTVKVEFLGLEDYSTKIDLGKRNRKVDLGIITMSTQKNELNEVTVSAEKNAYSFQLDKKVFDVTDDVRMQGGTALEVLDQIPQVTVQAGGQVQLRGSSDVLILINGRRSGLTMNNALDQIDVANIERVEVVTNPSARFDAQGSAGIINIILKKNKDLGWKGQIRTSVGTPADHTLLPSLSYKTKKLNLFGNVRLRYSDYNGWYNSNQTDKVNGLSLMKNEIEKRHDDGLSYYLGADYNFNANQFLTLAYFRSATKDTDTTTLNYEAFQNNESNTFVRGGNSLEKRFYNQLESNYTHKLKKQKAEWRVNMQYDFWNSNKDWSLLTFGNNLPENVDQNLRTENEASSADFVIGSDFEIPFLFGKLTTGAKWENRVVENIYLAESQIDNEWTVFRNINNDVTYTEKILAAYAEYGKQFKKWDYKIGLRMENSDIEISDAEGVYGNANNYTNLFPSAFLSYKPSETLNFQGSISRRISRPSLWNLYPFNEVTDVNFIEIGNPLLNPGYTNSYEFSMSIIGDKISLFPSFYFRATEAPVATYVSQTEDGILQYLPVNIDQENILGMDLTARFNVSKFIQLSGDLTYFAFDQSGTYNDTDLSAKGGRLMGRLSSRINLPAVARFQISYQYQGGRKNGQLTSQAISDLTISASRVFFNNRLEAAIVGRNILNSRVRKVSADSEQFSFQQESNRTRERFSLNLTYKFRYTNRDRMRTANRGNRN